MKMKILCKNKNWKLNEDYNLDKILYLLIDRPNCISPYNEYFWENKKDQWHRNYNLPAYIGNNNNNNNNGSYVCWYINDKCYRKNN